jgi:hypothetical protein
VSCNVPNLTAHFSECFFSYFMYRLDIHLLEFTGNKSCSKKYKFVFRNIQRVMPPIKILTAASV